MVAKFVLPRLVGLVLLAVYHKTEKHESLTLAMPSKISDTRFKLNEASYFYDQMKNNQDNTDAFLYNLDAFVSAARSVTWVLRQKFSREAGFEEWYKAEELVIGKDYLYQFNRRRISITHTTGNLKNELRKKVSTHIVFKYDISPDESASADPASEAKVIYAIPMGIVE
jgi:hypothetical protein